jgi:glycerol transport system ATP-binding protein
MATIELVNVSHAYTPGNYAVKNINLTWEHSISSAILGPSGCGKTTLLKIISGLLQPTEGRVLLNGEEVNHKKPKERNIAQIFQFPVVYETLSVFQNLAFPLKNRGMPDNLARERVLKIAELLELTDTLKQNASALGTAEKQLISLGRGIVREDLTAILLDEPLTVIDPHQKWHIRRKLKQLQQRLKITMIYVTHDQHEALTFADQVTVMDQGNVLQTGSPQELHNRPQSPFVGYFIGSPGMNLFDAELKGNQLHAGSYVISVSERTAREMAGQRLKIGIRPEFVEVLHSQYPGSIQCSVASIHLTGTSKILDLAGGGVNFKARVPDIAAIHVQDTVWVHFPDEHTLIYVNDQRVTIPEPEITE